MLPIASSSRVLPLLSVSVCLALVTGVPSRTLAQETANGHYELDDTLSKLKDDQGTVPWSWDGKQVGQSEWSAQGGTYTYKLHIDHDAVTVSDFQSTWTIAGLPPRQLAPGQTIKITATGNANANAKSFNKRDGTYAKFEGPSLDVSRSESQHVGWEGNEGSEVFTPTGQSLLEATVPRTKTDSISIKVYAGHMYRTMGALDRVYVYKWVEGPAKPDNPPGGTGEAAGKPRRKAPRVRVELDTMRYAPHERLFGTVEVRTGITPENPGSGELSWSVRRDTTGVDLFWMAAGAGGQATRKSADPYQEDLSGGLLEDVTQPSHNFRLEELPQIQVPDEIGEYTLVIELKMDDGKQASASAAFDVLDNPRRLIVGQVNVGEAPTGQARTISLPFAVSGQDAPGAQKPVARAFGEVYGLTGQAKGWSMRLDEQEPELRARGPVMRGDASWQVVLPEDGIYLITCQIVVPYYGAKEASEFTVAAKPADEGAGAGSTEGGGDDPGRGAESNAMTIPGTGLVIDLQDGGVLVTQVLPGSSAHKSGIVPGDTLISIDNQPVAGMTLLQISQGLAPTGKDELHMLKVRTADGKTSNHVIHPQENAPVQPPDTDLGGEGRKDIQDLEAEMQDKLAAGELEAALSIARELVRRSPEEPSSHMDLAAVCNEVGTQEEAIAEVRVAVSLAPGDPEIVSSAAVLLTRMQQEPLARSIVADGIEHGIDRDALLELLRSVKLEHLIPPPK